MECRSCLSSWRLRAFCFLTSVIALLSSFIFPHFCFSLTVLLWIINACKYSSVYLSCLRCLVLLATMHGFYKCQKILTRYIFSECSLWFPLISLSLWSPVRYMLGLLRLHSTSFSLSHTFSHLYLLWFILYILSLVWYSSPQWDPISYLS